MWFYVMLALLGVLPASFAFAESERSASPMVGVWAGTIGEAPITACFQEDYHDIVKNGNYYYHRNLIPSSIGRKDNAANEVGAFWYPRWGKTNETWQIDRVSSDYIDGAWTSGDKSEKLPIRLKRIVLSSDDGETPCGSTAYNNAIEGSLRATAGPTQRVAGVKYHVLTLALPDRGSENGSDSDHSMETIEIEGDSQSVSAINVFLRQLNSKEHMFGCRLLPMNRAAHEEFYRQSAAVSMVGRWLSVSISGSSPCGRMMQVWDDTYTLNMVTGTQESLFDWFWGMPLANNPKDIRREGPLPEQLGDFVSARRKRANKRSDEYLESCYGTVRPSYQLVLKPDGIIFEVPTTRNGSCGDSIKLGFKQLWPFLNEDGLKYAKELRVNRKAK